MDLGLKGKKVILTGGSRGIGRAALEIFAAEGCDVAFFSRNQKQVDETAAALKKFGGKVYGSTFDLNNLASGYAGWLTRAADQLGGCDIFVPGASASGSQATGDWQKCFEFDVLGTVKGCETLAPYLEKSGSGSVIVMSSTAAAETFIVPQAFNAFKAALLTYAKQLSQAWGPKGIRVNSVMPGPISFPTGNWETIKLDRAREIAGRVEHFVRTEVAGYERDPRVGVHGPSADLVDELRAKARAAGVLTPHVLADGSHLTHRETAIVLRAAGLSTLGPLAVNVSAPYEVNMFLIGKIGTPEQKRRFLQPVLEGRVRSAFFMTEPAAEGGAGSDPSMMQDRKS